MSQVSAVVAPPGKRHRLTSLSDARVVFETSAPKLDREAAKPLYKLFHSFESHFGDLTQIRNIEERMAKLYPENPSLSYFSDRFSSADFDPSAAQIIISPNTQARPKAIPNGISSADEFGGGNHLSPNSPKRSLPSDLSDREDERPRKFARSDSPLKGAAGKRVEQLKRSRPAHDSTPPLRSPTSRMAALHQPISSFASCQQLIKLVRDLPKAELYDLPRFNPEKVCALVQGTNL